MRGPSFCSGANPHEGGQVGFSWRMKKGRGGGEKLRQWAVQAEPGWGERTERGDGTPLLFTQTHRCFYSSPYLLLTCFLLNLHLNSFE